MIVVYVCFLLTVVDVVDVCLRWLSSLFLVDLFAIVVLQLWSCRRLSSVVASTWCLVVLPVVLCVSWRPRLLCTPHRQRTADSSVGPRDFPVSPPTVVSDSSGTFGVQDRKDELLVAGGHLDSPIPPLVVPDVLIGR